MARWRPPKRRLGRFLGANAIETVLDVGANRGQFGSELRSAGFRGRIISFEPLGRPFALLAEAAAVDPLWEAHQLALGGAREQRSMNVAANSASSSFLDIAGTHLTAAPEARTVSAEQVTTVRLDDLAAELAFDPGSTLLKLDVQGFHLAVLEGATAILNDLAAVQCEISVVPLYLGEPQLIDVLCDLRGRGFELVELEPGFYDPAEGRILQFDGRFVRAVSNGASTASAKRSES
ncbi:MAG: FkbM family methyltransferase [Gaiellaceae bacterium]